MTTIDLTPTRSEHARVTAYIMASHLTETPYIFGDYWNYTETEENAIFGTWNKLEEIHAVYRDAGLDFWQDCPKVHKAKLIKALYREILEELSK